MTTFAPKQTLLDELLGFLREHPEGISSDVLAAKFLKLKNVPPKVADGTIRAVLADDRRVCADKDGLWHAVKDGADRGESLQSHPWSAVYCLTDPSPRRRILQFSLWNLYPAPACAHAVWLVDPGTLPYDESSILQGDAEVPDTGIHDAGVAAFAREIRGRIPVFLTSNQRDLLASECAYRGENLPDDTVLIRELLKAAVPDGGTLPRSLDLAECEKIVLGAEQTGRSVLQMGERFATAVYELFELLKRKGIETRADLDKYQTRETAPLFSGKQFSYDDILALPPLPGVYAFKDVNGRHCYIGKASNLKRRLQSYWKESDESPEKLSRLRETAHSLVTHRCGSELECLLYEYRLIRKYAPPLNKKTGIEERNGTFRPIDDCIVLLPHAEAGKGMSIWFRGNQKILLKPFDASFPDQTLSTAELNSFFFSPVLPAGDQDFPEQEIATRWIKQHEGTLAMLQVSRMANAEEIRNALKSLWREYSGSLPVHAAEQTGETRVP
jgi:hypothetical protein